MPDRWIRLCRRVVPRRLRDRVFDPTVADLAARRATRPDRRLPRFVARLAFAGAVLVAALECRFVGGDVSVDPLRGPRKGWLAARRRDLWLAIRRLVREPVFTLFAIATLTLGIGANVALFSLVNADLLARLPVPNSRDVIRVYESSGDDGRRYDVTSYPNFLDARAAAPDLDLAVHMTTGVLVGDVQSGDEQPLELVSGAYFRALGLVPAAGRLLDDRDIRAEGASPVVVIGESFWRTRFDGRADVVGRTLRLNSVPYTIVGIAPAGFAGTMSDRADLWAPVTMQQQLRPRGSTMTLARRGWGWLHVIGRLGPGVSMARAQAELDRAAADINVRVPSKTGVVFTVVRAGVLEATDEQVLLPFIGLTAVFSVLLLIVSCANLAGLMQARATTRRRERAIRLSLGAARGRLVVEDLAESVVTAAAGTIGALVLAAGVGRALVDIGVPPQVARGFDTTPLFDWYVFGFAALVGVVAVLLVGLLPALRARGEPVALLKDDAATMAGGRTGSRLRRVAVFVQVTAATVLVIASGLLAASLHNMRGYDPGFQTDRLAMVSVSLGHVVESGDEAGRFAADLVARVRALPGVLAADVATDVPLTNNQDSMGVHIPGYVPPDGGATVTVAYNVVGAGYFGALGLPFLAGGPWLPAVPSTGVVVNATMARRFWPARSAVGQVIEAGPNQSLVVTGVVKDSAYYSIGEASFPFMYVPAEVLHPTGFTLLARATADPSAMLRDLSRAVTAVNPRVRPLDPTTFDEARAAELAPRVTIAWSASAFGLVALALAAIGLFGVVATSVGQRTREIGIRIALGLRPAAALSGVLAESLTLAAGGAVVGLAGAVLAGRALHQWLFGVGPFDVRVYLASCILLGAVAILAAWVPARRASRVDPVIALRS